MDLAKHNQIIRVDVVSHHLLRKGGLGGGRGRSDDQDDDTALRTRVLVCIYTGETDHSCGAYGEHGSVG